LNTTDLLLNELIDGRQGGPRKQPEEESASEDRNSENARDLDKLETETDSDASDYWLAELLVQAHGTPTVVIIRVLACMKSCGRAVGSCCL